MISPKAARDRRQKPAPVPPQPIPPLGISTLVVKEPACYDFSGWEPGLDISRMVPRPEMVYCRATLDYWYVDPVMRGYEKQCNDLGIPFQSYHFFHPGHIQAQVDNYLGATIGIKTPAILDVEYSPGIWPLGVRGRQLANDVLAWLELVETATKIKPIIYTNKNYFSYLNYDPTGGRNYQTPRWANSYQFIIAWYPNRPNDFSVPPQSVIPAGVTDVIAWQYFDDGRSNGASANDLNVMLK